MLNTHVKLAPACFFGDEAGVGDFDQSRLGSKLFCSKTEEWWWPATSTGG